MFKDLFNMLFYYIVYLILSGEEMNEFLRKVYVIY